MPLIELRRDLVLYLRFLEGSGETTFKDLSGQGNHGAAANGAATVAGGKLGRGLALAGGTQHVNCGDDSSLALTRWTLAAWFYRNTNVASRYRIFGKDKTGPNELDYFFHWDNTGNEFEVGFRSGGVDKRLNVSTTAPLNTWVYFLATFDGTFIRLYRNNVLIGTSADFSAFTPDTTAGTDLHLGRLLTTYTPGHIQDETTIHGRAINADERAALYKEDDGAIIRHAHNPANGIQTPIFGGGIAA